MPLNARWIKFCPACHKFWCSKGEKCGAPDCECIDQLKVRDIRDDVLGIVTCGACDKAIKDWLSKGEPPRVLKFKMREIPIRTWDTDDIEGDK